MTDILKALLWERRVKFNLRTRATSNIRQVGNGREGAKKRREAELSACAYPKGVLFTGSRIESDGGVTRELATMSPDEAEWRKDKMEK